MATAIEDLPYRQRFTGVQDEHALQELRVATFESRPQSAGRDVGFDGYSLDARNPCGRLLPWWQGLGPGPR